MMPQIAISGSLAYDFLSFYDRPFEEVLLPDCLDRLSVCFVTRDKQRHFGGTAGNIAYGFASLGFPAAVVAAAGTDAGDYLDRFSDLGIDSRCVTVYPGFPTASATIITDPKGNQICEFHDGAMGASGNIEVESLFRAVRLLIVSPDPGFRMRHYCSEAIRLGLPYFFDPGQRIPALTDDELRFCIQGAQGLFMNEYEESMLKRRFGGAYEDLIRDVSVVVLTRGNQGSLISERQSSTERLVHEIPPVLSENVKDPTGCGDAYRAGFLKGYLENRDLMTCGRMGSLLASYNLSPVGTQTYQVDWKTFVQRYQDVFKAAL